MTIVPVTMVSRVRSERPCHTPPEARRSLGDDLVERREARRLPAAHLASPVRPRTRSKSTALVSSHDSHDGTLGLVLKPASAPRPDRPGPGRRSARPTTITAPRAAGHSSTGRASRLLSLLRRTAA